MRTLLIDQNVSNTDLIISLKIMQGNPTPESQNEFINQMIHARFLCLATFDPEPIPNEKGEYEIAEGMKLLMNSVASEDKKAFIVAFTETKEAMKQKKRKGTHYYHDLSRFLQYGSSRRISIFWVCY